MNDAIKKMLENYGTLRDQLDEEFALKEIIQQISLLGLYRGGFFEQAAFYGGTSLRLLFGLDRFSEDLDFCLKESRSDFSLKPYLESLSLELKRYGFTAAVEVKEKNVEGGIESAFVKQNTLEALLVIDQTPKGRPKNQLLKIKLEVDKLNPPGARYVRKLIKLPTPFMVQTLDESSLFAGKCHAIVARTYQNRVKGRDYYDFLFYTSRNAVINLTYLESKLRDSKHYSSPNALTLKTCKELLIDRFKTVDFNKAIRDVEPFLKYDDRQQLADWSPELFLALVNELKASN